MSIYTHTIQHCFPQENLIPFQISSSQQEKHQHTNEPQTKRSHHIFSLKNRSESTESKSKPKSRFSIKIKAILKSPTAPRHHTKPVRLSSGKKVTWNVDEEQVQPGECQDTGDAWPSGSEEDQQINVHHMDHGRSYIITPDMTDENSTPTHIHHRREEEIFDPIIPFHTRTINPLRAANTHLKVSHKRSSSLPADDVTQNKSYGTNHKRFASCDAQDFLSVNSSHQEAQLYKQANVDWTKNRVKSNEPSKKRLENEFFSLWSENNPDQSIFENLSHFLDAEPAPTTKRLSFPICDDQLSIIESEASSVHTFFENDDRLEDVESHSFLYPHYIQNASRQDEFDVQGSRTRMMLPPIHPQPPRKNKESYIILPMQNYEISTVCEVTLSSELALLPSNSLTEITFETKTEPESISKKVSPIICEMSDSQYPPFYINSSTSLPHLHYMTKSNPRMSCKQSPHSRNTTLPRAKRQHHSPYQHVIPDEHDREHYKRLSSTPQSGSGSYLACDKSTGQLITPSLKRGPFKRGGVKNELSLRPSTSFTHLYSRSQPRSMGNLKGSSSENCVRDEYSHPSPYICQTAKDTTPAYIPQEMQTPYMNIDMISFIDQENEYAELESSEQTGITYIPPPRYFTPRPLGICCECKEHIYPSACQPIRIHSKMMHPDCFKCVDCYSLLHVLSYQVLDGKFYCPRDFKRRITCHVCKVPIASYRGRESPVNVYNKFFHLNCYRCTSCNTQNQKLSFDGRWLLCLPCAHARRQQQVINPVSEKGPRHRKSHITLL